MPSLVPATASAAAVARTGLGDGVFISIDSGTTWLQLMHTKNMAYSNQKINFDDVTTTTSVNAVIESFPTTEDPGNFTFDMVVDPADPGQVALAAAYDARTPLKVTHVYKLQPNFTTPANNVFAAWVEQNPVPGSDVTKATTVSASLKISGNITRNPAAA
jgi:hypothetical protein